MYVSKANFTAAEPLIAEILQKDLANTSATAETATRESAFETGTVDSGDRISREAAHDQPGIGSTLLLMAAADSAVEERVGERQYADALKASGLDPNIALGYVAFLQAPRRRQPSGDVLTEVGPQSAQHAASATLLRLSWRERTGAIRSGMCEPTVILESCGLETVGLVVVS